MVNKKMGYTRGEIINICKNIEPKELYKARCVNYTGKTIDSHEYYTEVIAEFILGKINDGEFIIKESTRNNWDSYNHVGSYNPLSTRVEEIIAIQLWHLSKEKGSINPIGKILDYQVPLKENNADSKGKIDLLSYNEKDHKAIILELKKPTTPETLLRCVLECYTYKELLPIGNKNLKNKYHELSDCKGKKAAPLIFRGENSRPYIEFCELNNCESNKKEGERRFLKALMAKLDINPFFLASKEYEIDEKLE